MEGENYIKTILEFMQEAGSIAIRHFHDSEPKLKDDGSVITLADREISSLARRYLDPYLKDPAHILIDEEDPQNLKYFNQPLLDNASCLWALDPIDGTILYANQIPTFGISLGLCKNLKPWLGAVYFPILRELFFCDGDKSFFVRDAFTEREEKKEIAVCKQTLTPSSVIMCDDGFYRDLKDKHKPCHVLVSCCAVVDLTWPCIGRALGTVFQSRLWDFVGTWPVLMSAGLIFRAMKSGKILDKIDLDLFQEEKAPWKLKEPFIIASAENYSSIGDIFPKTN